MLGVVVSVDAASTTLPTYEVIASELDSSAGDGMVLTKTVADMCERLADAVGPQAGGPQASGSQATSTQTSQPSFATVGLAVAGLADRSGVVRYSPNLPEILEFPLTQTLTAELATRFSHECAVSLDNDANAGTWAEAHLGAGRDCENFVFVTLGTGIGTGFVVNRRLVQGANGFAGETGHMVVDASGPAHITGVKGPWEYFASGIALRRMGRAAAAAGNFDAGIELAGSAETVTSHHVHDAVSVGDPQALQILDEYSDQVALGISNLVMIFDPQRIIIGGGVADIGEPLRSRVEGHLAKTILGASYRPMPDVVLAELGSQSSAIGAALMANDLIDPDQR